MNCGNSDIFSEYDYADCCLCDLVNILYLASHFLACGHAPSQVTCGLTRGSLIFNRELIDRLQREVASGALSGGEAVDDVALGHHMMKEYGMGPISRRDSGVGLLQPESPPSSPATHTNPLYRFSSVSPPEGVVVTRNPLAGMKSRSSVSTPTGAPLPSPKSSPETDLKHHVEEVPPSRLQLLKQRLGFGLRNHHSWLGPVLVTIDDPYTRSKRLTVLLTMV